MSSNTHAKKDGVFIGPYEIKLNIEKGVFEAITSGGLVAFSAINGAEVHNWAWKELNPEVFRKEAEGDNTDSGRSSEA